MSRSTIRYGTSDIILLLALRRAPDYAYHLWRDLETAPFPFSKALLYARLGRLVFRGCLVRERRGRTYVYTITPSGIAHLESEIKEWRALAKYLETLTSCHHV